MSILRQPPPLQGILFFFQEKKCVCVSVLSFVRCVTKMQRKLLLTKVSVCMSSSGLGFACASRGSTCCPAGLPQCTCGLPMGRQNGDYLVWSAGLRRWVVPADSMVYLGSGTGLDISSGARNSTAVGASSVAAVNAAAFGANAQALGNASVVLGAGASGGAQGETPGSASCVVLGSSASCVNGAESIVIGTLASIGSSVGTAGAGGAVVVGRGSRALDGADNTTVVGSNSTSKQPGATLVGTNVNFDADTSAGGGVVINGSSLSSPLNGIAGATVVAPIRSQQGSGPWYTLTYNPSTCEVAYINS
jgi:hypothetical protein